MSDRKHLRAVPDAVYKPSDQEQREDFRRIDEGGGGPHDPGMEARVAKLEAHVEHIRSGVDEIKSDLRDIQSMLGKHGENVGKEFVAIRRERSAETWRVLGIGGTAFVLLLGVMAKGFGWL